MHRQRDFLLHLLAILQIGTCFTAPKCVDPSPAAAACVRGPRVLLQAAVSSSSDNTIGEEIRSMSVKEIKDELIALGAHTKDIFEKEELVQRLAEARRKYSASSTASPRQGPSTAEAWNLSNRRDDALEAPLFFKSLKSGTRVEATTGEGISIDSSINPYPAIQIDVQNGTTEFKLMLLLDTACSGTVLRPSVVKKYNLPSLSTPVTMTGAGGVEQNTGLTQLNSFRLASKVFGPLPAAVQDIGALPSSLDGIIGLSFLGQFAGAELNFQRGSLLLYRKGQPIPLVSSGHKVVADGPMSLTPLGVYSVDVFLGGRGPVKMLVDTGASNTLLNWKGVENLGLSRDSKFLNRLPSFMGAMGSDAVAMALTHRINISSNLNLAGRPTEGLSLSDARRLSVDIGDIAILTSFPAVGGILGIDVMMRCDAVRFSFDGAPRMFMLEREL